MAVDGDERDRAPVGWQQTGDDAQQRRLADAVGADEADALAGVDGEVDIDQQMPGAERQGEAAGVKSGRHEAPP